LVAMVVLVVGTTTTPAPTPTATTFGTRGRVGDGDDLVEPTGQPTWSRFGHGQGGTAGQQDHAHQPEQAQAHGRHVDRGAGVAQRDVTRSRDHHHEVGTDPVGAIGAFGLPVGEVRRLDEHRHPGAGDVEGDLVAAHVDGADGVGRELGAREVRDLVDGASQSELAPGPDGQATVVGGDGLHVDALPRLRPAVGEGHVELGQVAEPGRGDGQPLVLALAHPLGHDRLVVHGRNRGCVGHLIDVPRPADGDLVEVGVAAGGGNGGGRHRQVVADAEELEVADAGVDVEGRVHQVALGLRARC